MAFRRPCLTPQSALILEIQRLKPSSHFSNSEVAYHQNELWYTEKLRTIQQLTHNISWALKQRPTTEDMVKSRLKWK